MLKFKHISLEDREQFKIYTDKYPLMQCDISFEQLYLWRNDLSVQIGYYEDFLIVKCFFDGVNYFKYPVGGKNTKSVIAEMGRYCETQGYNLEFQNVTEENCREIEAYFPGEFNFVEERDNFDYIHLLKDLATFSGNALSRKRCECNRFIRDYNWSVQDINEQNIDDCKAFVDFWMRQNAERMDEDIKDEYVKLYEAFDNYELWGLEGICLWVDDRICALTFGRIITENTFDVFFEKADIDVYGAYPMVCRELVRGLAQKHPKLVYINREEDMGLLGLRKAKELYRPEFMIKKYTVSKV